jgi:hypothetical protein
MPVTVFGQTYKSHDTAVKAIKKKKGWSDSRANAYVAVVKKKPANSGGLGGSTSKGGKKR